MIDLQRVKIKVVVRVVNDLADAEDLATLDEVLFSKAPSFWQMLYDEPRQLSQAAYAEIGDYLGLVGRAQELTNQLLSSELEDTEKEQLIQAQGGRMLFALRNELNYRRVHGEPTQSVADEQLALIRYAREVEKSGPDLQNSLSWMKLVISRFESSDAIGEWLKLTKSISNLSMLGLLGQIRSRFNPQINERKEEIPEEVLEFLTELAKQLLTYCTSCRYSNLAIVLNQLAEIRNDNEGPIKEWSDQILLLLVDVVESRVEGDGDSIETWDLLKMVTAYGTLAKDEPRVKELLQTLAPYIEKSLTESDALETGQQGKYYDRYLAGALLAYSNVRHRTVEVYRIFELIAPHVDKLLLENESLLKKYQSEQSPLRVVPGNLVQVLEAYGRMLGNTDFENLPAESQKALLSAFKQAQTMIPTGKTGFKQSVLRFNRAQLFQLANAMMQFRRPPPIVRQVLSELVAPALQVIAGGSTRLSDLDHVLRGFTTGGEVEVAPLYVGVFKELQRRSDEGEAPSVTALRLAILSYNQKTALLDRAQLYQRDAERLESQKRRGKDSGDPTALKRNAGTLRTLHSDKPRSSVEEAPDLAEQATELLVSMLESVLKSIGSYNDNQRRSLLFQLTKIRGARSLPQEKKPEKSEESEEPQEERDPQPNEEEQLALEEAPPTLRETRIAELVGQIFHAVSDDKTLLPKLDELPTHQLGFLLFDYGWLRQLSENDRLLVKGLIETLEKRVSTLKPNELASLLSQLARLSKPTSEIVELIEGLTVEVAKTIARAFDALDFSFYARVLGAYRELPSAVVQHFARLLQRVLEFQLKRPKAQHGFANLLRALSTYVRFDDVNLDEAPSGESQFAIIDLLTQALKSNYDKQRDEDTVYDREKARIARESLPWRGYDQRLRAMYGHDEGLSEEVQQNYLAAQNEFRELDTAVALRPDQATLYEVCTVSPNGDFISSEIMDNLIFRELSLRQYDFIFVLLPKTVHIDKFKGVVPFRGKKYRIDTYGGSTLKAKKKKGETGDTIRAIGVEEAGIAFYRTLFNFQEGFFYMQRALLPNDEKPTIGLRGRIRGVVHPDGEHAFQFAGLPFKTHDGWGYIKRSVADTMYAPHKKEPPKQETPLPSSKKSQRKKKQQPPQQPKVQQPLKEARKLLPKAETANLSYQAFHWYPEDEDTVSEAVRGGLKFIEENQDKWQELRKQRQQQKSKKKALPLPTPKKKDEEDDEEEAPSKLMFRALTSGRPRVRNAVAVPVSGESMVLPTHGPNGYFEGADQGLLVGRSPYDNPNLYPIGKEKVIYRGQDERESERTTPSDFLAQMESVQYTMSGYTYPPESVKGGPFEGQLTFFKGMLGIVPDKLWPEGYEDVDLVVSNQDIKLDEKWEGEAEKPRLEKITPFVMQGLLVVKDWYTPQMHVGVPTDVQKWLAGDYDGDLATLIFARDNPELFSLVNENFKPTGVSPKIKKSFTQSGETLTRGRQIRDIMSPVLGMWSSLADRVLSVTEEERDELARALLSGNTLQLGPDQIAELMLEKFDEIVKQLRLQDLLLLTNPAEWYAHAGLWQKQLVKQTLNLDDDEETQSRLVKLLTEDKSLLKLLVEKVLPEALPKRPDPPQGKEKTPNFDKLAAWVDVAGERQMSVVRALLMTRLLELEIQMGIKIGTDGYKTKAETRTYLLRAREYLRTMAKVGIADQPVPYGKSLARRIEELGLPTLDNAEWRKIYFRSRAGYGIPARILERMIVELTPKSSKYRSGEALNEAFLEWQSTQKKKQKSESESPREEPKDKSGEKIEALNQVFETHDLSAARRGAEEADALAAAGSILEEQGADRRLGLGVGAVAAPAERAERLAVEPEEEAAEARELHHQEEPAQPGGAAAFRRMRRAGSPTSPTPVISRR